MAKKHPKDNQYEWDTKIGKYKKYRTKKEDNIYSVLGKTIEANVALGIYSAFSKSLKK